MVEVIEDRPIIRHGINYGLVDHYVKYYQEGSKYLSPNEIAVAKAKIALDEAYAKRTEKTFDPSSPDGGGWTTSEESLRQVLSDFGPIRPMRSPTFGVKNYLLPRKASLGEYVSIQYKFLGGKCWLAGFVSHVINMTEGRGLVIQIRDTKGEYAANPRRRHIALWIPNNPSTMGGLL